MNQYLSCFLCMVLVTSLVLYLTRDFDPVLLTVFNSPLNNSWTSARNSSVEFKIISFLNPPVWFPRTNFSECKIKTCRYTTGYKQFNVSDLVMFYGEYSSFNKVPRRPKPDQIWLVTVWEAPPVARIGVWSAPQWQNQINWTMTYRSDSDIPVPYGGVTRLDKPRGKNYTDIMAAKTNAVAWVVSHCNTDSRRERYVDQLRKVVRVDVFGRCGSPAPKDVFVKISRKYKFYLAFENSLCTDYVTEKLFERQGMDTVVVTRGMVNYREYCPQGSCIDTRDFKNASDLGNFLKKLDKDDEAYVKYLKAKENYVWTESLGDTIRQGMCRACEMLHAERLRKNVYRNFYNWWKDDKQCSKPKDIM